MSLRVVFMGTPEFAVASLRRILDNGFDVPLVVTIPDRTRGRGLRLQKSAVKQFAELRGLDVATPESLDDPAFLDRVRSMHPDVICVVAFRILPQVLFEIPSRGSFNLHASLLPKYRGAAPIQRAIMAGESWTGVTTFFLRSRVDTGSVVLQRRVPIGPDTTGGELHDTLMEIGADVVVDTLRLIERGEVVARQQSDAEATAAPKIHRTDRRLVWNRSAEDLRNWIRGLSPSPGAFTELDGRVIKIVRARAASPPRNLAPGEIHVDGTRLIVGAADGALEILELQAEGGRPMTADAFLRGNPIKDGTTFSLE